MENFNFNPNMATHVIGSNRNTITIYPPSQYRNFDNHGSRPSIFNMDDNFVDMARNAVQEASVNRDSRLLTELVKGSYTNNVCGISTKCDHVVDMSTMNNSYIFILELYEQPATPNVFMRNNYTTGTVGSTFNKYRVIYFGYFDQEPYHPATKTLNPNASMFLTHRTVLESAEYSASNGLMANVVRDASNLIMPVVDNMIIAGSNGIAPYMINGSTANVVDSIMFDTDNVGNTSIWSPTAAGSSNVTDSSVLYKYALRNDKNGVVDKSIIQTLPDKDVGRIMSAISGSLIDYSTDTVSGRALGSPMSCVDYGFDNLDSIVKNNIKRHMPSADLNYYGLRVNQSYSFGEVYQTFNLEVHEINVSSEFGNGNFGHANQTINSTNNVLCALLGALMSPILIQNGVLSLSCTYTSQRPMVGYIEEPCTGYKIEDIQFYANPRNVTSMVVDKVCSTLKSTVFSLIKQHLNNSDFIATCHTNNVGQSWYMVTPCGSQPSYEMYQHANLLGGFIDPTVVSGNTFNHNQEAIVRLTSAITNEVAVASVNRNINESGNYGVPPIPQANRVNIPEVFTQKPVLATPTSVLNTKPIKTGLTFKN